MEISIEVPESTVIRKLPTAALAREIILRDGWGRAISAAEYAANGKQKDHAAHSTNEQINTLLDAYGTPQFLDELHRFARERGHLASYRIYADMRRAA